MSNTTRRRFLQAAAIGAALPFAGATIAQDPPSDYDRTMLHFAADVPHRYSSGPGAAALCCFSYPAVHG